MGGGSSPRPPAVTAAVPSAADEEAASERARLYSLLRGRRGSRGLAYGPPKRMSLLAAPAVAPLATVAAVPSILAPLWGNEGGMGAGQAGDTAGMGGGFGGGLGGGFGDTSDRGDS
jgi:hypothetical protein